MGVFNGCFVLYKQSGCFVCGFFVNLFKSVLSNFNFLRIDELGFREIDGGFYLVVWGKCNVLLTKVEVSKFMC